MCGLGDKDRRQVTPPPFVRCVAYQDDSSAPVDVDALDVSQLVLLVSLRSADGSQDCTLSQDITGLASDGSSDDSAGDVPTRNLIGATVLNAFTLIDDSSTRGIWFILSDISVRIEGEFTLLLTLVNLATMETTQRLTQRFHVYSAKKFPGVVDSIPLGKLFVSQGVKIPMRRESREGQY